MAKSSAGPAKGASSHGEGCECQRCRGFQAGHELTLRHGAYASPARLGEETDALAEMLAPLVPAYRESDSVLVSLLALALRRVARAEPSIAEAEARGERDVVDRLERSQRQWANSAARFADLLGMDPTARIRLGLDVALTRRALTVADLHAQAAEEAVEGDADDSDQSDAEAAA